MGEESKTGKITNNANDDKDKLNGRDRHERKRRINWTLFRVEETVGKKKECNRLRE